MTCWKPPSRRSSRTPATRWRWTGRTWSPSPARPPARGGPCADPEASWGHRKNNLLRSENELFFGYYLSAAIMMPDENGPAIPELARRATLSSCRHDPVRAFAPVLTAMPGQAASRSATSSPTPATPTATPPPGRSRSAAPGRSSSRTSTRTTAAPRAPTTARSSPTGTCTAPSTPRALLELGPLARTATRQQAADSRTQDRRTRPLQARPHHRRRHRRLPPGAVPRRHGQDPLPPARRRR